jgi:hypothetical protein
MRASGKVGGDGEEIRQAVLGGIRHSPAVDGAVARARKGADGVYRKLEEKVTAVSAVGQRRTWCTIDFAGSITFYNTY